MSRGSTWVIDELLRSGRAPTLRLRRNRITRSFVACARKTNLAGGVSGAQGLLWGWRGAASAVTRLAAAAGARHAAEADVVPARPRLAMDAPRHFVLRESIMGKPVTEQDIVEWADEAEQG